MKKFITVGLLACVLVSTVSIADSVVEHKRVQLGASVDYTWTFMHEVNDELNKGADVREFGSGIAGMLDFGIGLNRFLMVGVRGGYLHCIPANSSYNYVLYNQTTTISASLIPLEAGLCVNVNLPVTSISLMAGVYIGYGFAFASYKNEISALSQTSTVTLPYKGGRLIGELLTGVNFKVSPALSLNINGGYRIAKIARMEQSKDVNYSGITGVTVPVGKKGDVLKDSENDNLAFDFSGFSIGAGFSVGF